MESSHAEQLLVDLHDHVYSRTYGKYRGIVTDVDVPETMGRIKAKVPEVYGADDESPWAIPVSPFAGAGHGLVLIPEVDDGVWIEFEGGDPSRPLWVGCWWGRDELTDPADVKKRVLATTAGHKLVFNDDDDEIQLLHAGGAELKMTDDEITLTKASSEVKITGDEITLKVGSSQITMTSSDITLKSGSGQVKISASGVDLDNGVFTVR